VHRDDPGHCRAHRGGDGLTADAVTEWAGEVGELEDARSQDDGGGQQEGVAGRVLVVHTPQQSGAHDHAVAADPGDQPRRLSQAHRPGLAQLEGVQAPKALLRGAFAQGHGSHVRAAAQPFGGDQDKAVDDQEDGGADRRGQGHSDGVLEGQAQDARGNAGSDDQPRQALGRCLDPTLAQGAKEAGDDHHPLPPEVDQQPDGATDVKHHHKGQPGRLRARLKPDQRVPAEQTGKEDGVAQAGDGEQLGDALQETEQDGLEPADRVRGGQRQEGDRGGHGRWGGGWAGRAESIGGCPWV